MLIDIKQERMITGILSTLKDNKSLICNYCGNNFDENNILLNIDFKKKSLLDKCCYACYEK